MRLLLKIFCVIFGLLLSVPTLAQETPDSLNTERVETPDPAIPTQQDSSAALPALTAPPQNDSTNTSVQENTDTPITPTPTTTTQNDSANQNPPENEVIKNQFIYFLKDRVILNDNSTIFNILVLKNPTNKPLSGELSFYTPNGWNVIYTSFGDLVNISPGDSMIIPLRIAVGSNTKGDIANIINASIRTSENVNAANFYVQVPKESRWRLNTSQNTVYFNEYFEEVQFDIHLNNDGNADEMIKLEFETGKLLVVDELPREGRGSILYIPLAPGRDTSLTFTVRTNDLSFDDQDRFEQIWKESTITVRASTQDYRTKQTIWFKQINNEYNNRQFQRLFPLNVTLQFNNLLSTTQPLTNANIFGTTLLENKREVSYFLGVLNANLNPNNERPTLETEQNLIYSARYKDSTKEITVGNLRSTGVMFAGIGRGVSARYNVTPKHRVGASYSKNLFLPIHNYSAEHSTTAVKKLTLHTAVNYEDNQTNENNHLISQVRGNYAVYKGHRAGIGIRSVNSQMGYIANDTAGTERDTNLSDIGYEFNYSHNNQKIRTIWRYFDYRNIEAKTGGVQYLRGSLFYFFENRSRIHGIFDRRFQNLNRFPANLYTDDSYEIINELGRLTYGKNISRSVFYEIGPLYNFFSRKTPPSIYTDEEFASRTYSLFGSMRFQVGAFGSISPFVSYGLTYIESFDINSNTSQFETDRPTTSLRTGANYRDRYWGLSTFYSNGPVNFFEAQSFANQGIRSQVLNFRPSYRRQFYRKKLLFTAYLNYITRAPSQRESSNFSTRFDFHPTNKWHLYATTNLFTSAYVDDEVGRVSNRNFNLIAGIRKSFDIQHPRIRAFDLNIVIFNDLNGNQIMDPGDRPLANILTEIEAMDYDKTKGINLFRQIEFVSDPDGTVNYYGMPMGEYKLKFVPMESLKDLYNINGSVQTIILNSNTTYYVPYGESYKILGKINLVRDDFSSEGTIDVSGVRVSAVGPNHEVYSVLTDNFGNYVLYVPQAAYYTVSASNIFGDRFELENGSFTVNFSGFKNYKLDFKFIEKKRKIKMNGDFDFNLNDTNDQNE